MKTRKLYQVRVHPTGATFGRQVGHKGRLLPRTSALRVAKRLRSRGHFVTVDAMTVTVTTTQAARLDRRST